VSPLNYGLVTSVDELEALCSRLAAATGPIGFDIETGYGGPDKEKYSLHPETALVAGISITDDPTWARYIPLAHDSGETLDNRQAARLLWPILSSGRGVAHNAPFELRHLSRWFRHYLADDPAVQASNGYFPIRSDTQVEAFIAAEHPSFGLKFLTKAMFDHQMTELHELFPGLPVNKRKCLRFNILDQHDTRVINYACEDAAWCLAIHRRYYDSVADTLLYRVEMAVVEDCIPAMEDFGVRYDWPAMRRTADDLRVFRDRYNAEIMRDLTDMTGKPIAINLASPAQVGKLLFGQLGYRTTVYTAKTRDLPAAERKMSTGKIALASLAKKHPVVQQIRDWKEMTRLLGTYLERYETLYQWAEDGMTHPNHMSAVVVTGRFAVSDPPYQQSPKVYHFDLEPAREVHARHAEEHGDKCNCDDPQFAPPDGTCFRFNFRDMVIAPEDHYLLGFDLSQAELRAIAGEAQEPELLRAFEEGRDVHTLTASLMLGVPVEQITKKQRDIGKCLNFALLYGMGVKSLADRLGIPVEEAQELYNAYFSVYSRIAAWVDKQVELGRAQGYVTSRFGRRLPIWEYASDKSWIRAKGDRACVNYPIQGAATGDYMKIAMVRAKKALRKAGLADRVHLVMNVHDALEFYVRRSLQPQDVIAVLQPAVIFPVPGWPPMQADWHFGKRWGSPIDITVEADGRFVVRGEVEYELKPSLDFDEETGETIEVLPDVDQEVLREVLRRPAPPAADSRTVIIDMQDMPTSDGFRGLLGLLDTHPGENKIILRTPEGDLPLDCSSAIDLGHLGELSLILGTVKLYYDAATVGDLTNGLTL
jgi:DNA polymerase-1